ncbi:TnsA endonuclease N-terminal domain-containing protein [Advenella kashmirensis]
MTNRKKLHNRYSFHTPARRVVTPSGGIVRGKFPSLKNNRMVRYEGLIEADAVISFELNPAIIHYREQPYKVKYPRDGKLRTYTPDFELLISNGETLLVEIKHSEFMRRPENKTKYQVIADWLLFEQTHYTIITEQELRVEPRLGNLRYIYRQLSKKQHTRTRLKIILSSLNEYEQTTVGRLNIAVAKYQLTAFDFLAAGMVSCSLDEPISNSTALTRFEENENGWFYICKKYGF